MDGVLDGPARRVTSLRGRGRECAVLDQLVENIRHGEGRSLVIRGEAGVGKTALLGYLVETMSDLVILRTAGVELEIELPYASLHQLCAPLLDRLQRLPAPQREALEIVFALSAGAPPDRFMVGLAVLNLLSEAAEDRPLVCLIDDAQWVDQASLLTLGFVARRLLAESVALVFAAREPPEELEKLSRLSLDGLRNGDARALLATVVRSKLDDEVRDRIVAETHGNPLALLELPRGLSATELGGGFGLMDAHAIPGRIEESYRQRLAALPPQTKQLLLIAAAEPVGDPILVRRAAERLGLEFEATAPAAEKAGLLSVEDRVAFRHPLVRSAIYGSATVEDRRAVHLALAQAIDRELAPDRHAWHLAAAAIGPDEEVASELERSASRAQARGGVAAAAAFLQRALALTAHPERRARRALAAAQAHLEAGAFDAALRVLDAAQGGPLNAIQAARVKLIRAQIAFASLRGSGAPPLLLAAARQLEPLDLRLARDTYLEALSAVVFAGRLATGGGVLEIAQSALAAPRSEQPERVQDLLLDGLATTLADGHAAGTPKIVSALAAMPSGRAEIEEGARWYWLASQLARLVWDYDTWNAFSEQLVEDGRRMGALARLPLSLNALAVVRSYSGDLDDAALLVAEADAIAEVTGGRLAPYGGLAVAVWRGQEKTALDMIAESTEDIAEKGEGMGLTVTHFAKAALYNSLGRYAEALEWAGKAVEHPHELWLSNVALMELIEAASRVGDLTAGARALERLAQSTRASGSNWALGAEARARALLSDGEEAEALYREAIARFDRTRLRGDSARTRLLFGEWLRRDNRRVESREPLQTAHEMFTSIGAEAFAARARAELSATGKTARRQTVETRDDLTAHERQIAQLARDGLSNPEIGARLFLSPRTVEWHLHHVFIKLGIRSRRQLTQALNGS